MKRIFYLFVAFSVVMAACTKKEDKKTVVKNEAVQVLVKNRVEIYKYAILKLNNLILVANQNSENSNTISCNVTRQLESSDTIKSKIHNVVEDTKKAISGSQTNIQLGQALIQNLEN